MRDYALAKAIADAHNEPVKPMHATIAAQRLYVLAGMPSALKPLASTRGTRTRLAPLALARRHRHRAAHPRSRTSQSVEYEEQHAAIR